MLYNIYIYLKVPAYKLMCINGYHITNHDKKKKKSMTIIT